jgi:D-glycero-alpha-D-manno-heptose-7-phosphate kinase
MCRRPIGMAAIVVTRAPTRIDLGGGWTDVPPYSDREGGFVCNIAINRYAMATIGPGESGASDDHLVNALVRRLELESAAVSLESDFPVSAGLGGSSSATAAILVAAAELRGVKWAPAEIAEAGRLFEVEDLGIAGGRQDHYAATFGGALALKFGNGIEVRRIPFDARRAAEFGSRCVLIYTGESRISGDTIAAVLGAYESGEARVVDALARMRALAMLMATALEHGDFDSVGDLLGEHWRFQRDLHPSIPTARIDKIVSKAKEAGALGAKAMGASGGGCVLIIAPDGGAERVRRAVAPFGKVLDFGLDMDGVTVLKKRGE